MSRPYQATMGDTTPLNVISNSWVFMATCGNMWLTISEPEHPIEWSMVSILSDIQSAGHLARCAARSRLKPSS